MNENVMKQVGIETPMKIDILSMALNQLVMYQNRGDIQVAEEKEDELYLNLVSKYNELMATDPDYDLPLRMDKWEPLDVFFFMKMKKHDEDLMEKFLKSLSKNKINGKRLLELMTNKMPFSSVGNF